MLAELHSYITSHGLIRHGQKILLTVSGGIDSMVMADLFLHLPYETGIAHCNFSLRGEESDMDEQLVYIFCNENKIPFHNVRFDTKKYARQKGISVQMAARELRYNWFEEIRNQNNYDLIAIAHNLNDNVETMLINLVRGTGLAGISGMRPVSGRIIRPLLFATREKIEEYCSFRGIAYREDKSNAETKYTRNKIRHKIIPLLREINPSLLFTLSESIERFGNLNEIVAGYISVLRREISIEKDNSIIFPLTRLRELAKNPAVLFELFRPFSLNSMQLHDLKNILEGRTGSQIFTETHRIVRNRNEIIVTTSENVNEFRIEINNNKEFPGFISAEDVNIDKDFLILSDPSVACLDSEKVVFPLTLRKWTAGDYFYPLGMKHKKKLSDYFIDKKYPLTEKEKKLVLESNGDIIWIPGDRIDDRYKITGETRRALILRFSKE
jgi:tRNA(Ile)-lysidine synthase